MFKAQGFYSLDGVVCRGGAFAGETQFESQLAHDYFLFSAELCQNAKIIRN